MQPQHQQVPPTHSAGLQHLAHLRQGDSVPVARVLAQLHPQAALVRVQQLERDRLGLDPAVLEAEVALEAHLALVAQRAASAGE